MDEILQALRHAVANNVGVRFDRKATMKVWNYIGGIEQAEEVEVKTMGQLIDELCIENLKVWHLIEQAERGDDVPKKKIQDHNAIRRSLVRALDRRLGDRDIGGRA